VKLKELHCILWIRTIRKKYKNILWSITGNAIAGRSRAIGKSIKMH
jgi:hypothetical protein